MFDSSLFNYKTYGLFYAVRCMIFLRYKQTTTMKKLFNIIKGFLTKVFTPVNISKIIIIFTVGFVSRYLINEYYNINVFTEYCHLISIGFYSIFSIFIVFIHELFTFFDIDLISKLKSIVSIHPIRLDSDDEGYPLSTYTYKDKTGGLKIYKDYKEYREAIRAEYPHIANEHSNSRSNIHPAIRNNNQDYMSSNQNQYNTNNNNNYIDFNQYDINNQNYISRDRTRMNNGLYSLPNQDISGQFYQDNFNTDINGYFNQNNFSQDRFFTVDSLNINGTERALNSNVSLINPNPSRVDNSQYYLPTSHHTNNVYEHNRRPTVDNVNQISKSNNNQSSRLRSNSMPLNERHQKEMRNYEEMRNRRIQTRTREDRGRAFDQIVQPLQHKEIDVPVHLKEGKVILGKKYYHGNIKEIYVKFHDFAKRELYWNLWVKERDTHISYHDFKKNFDPNMPVLKDIFRSIKTDVSKEIHQLLNSSPVGTRHNALGARDIKVTNNNVYTKLNEIGANRNRAKELPRVRSNSESTNKYIEKTRHHRRR